MKNIQGIIRQIQIVIRIVYNYDSDPGIIIYYQCIIMNSPVENSISGNSRSACLFWQKGWGGGGKQQTLMVNVKPAVIGETQAVVKSSIFGYEKWPKCQSSMDSGFQGLGVFIPHQDTLNALHINLEIPSYYSQPCPTPYCTIQIHLLK